MKEIAAFRALLSRERFVQYRHVFLNLTDLPFEHKQVMRTLNNYYTEFPDTEQVSVDELQSYFESRNPSVKNASMLEKLFSDIRSAEILNSDLLTKVLQTYVAQYYCGAISQLTIDGLEGNPHETLDKIEQTVEKYREEISGIMQEGAEDNDVCLTPFSEIIDTQVRGGYKWPLAEIENNFGTIKRATLGHIFARPGIGKSSLAINIALKVAQQLKEQESPVEDGIVLYLNNEEAVEVIRMRALCCISFKTKYDLLDPHKLAAAEEKYRSYGGDEYIKFVGSVYHIATVEQKIMKHKPAVTVIDQGPKVAIYNRDVTEVTKLQILYNQYREMAKRYNTAIITVGQAASDAENKEYLTLNHLDSSKVGIPGELDWALGIGAKNVDSGSQTRYFNVAKNKGQIGRGSVKFYAPQCRYADYTD